MHKRTHILNDFNIICTHGCNGGSKQYGSVVWVPWKPSFG